MRVVKLKRSSFILQVVGMSFSLLPWDILNLLWEQLDYNSVISVSDVLAPRMRAKTYRHLALRLGRDMEMVIQQKDTARNIHDLKRVVSQIVEAQKRQKDQEQRVAALRCPIVHETNEDHGKVLRQSKDT